MDNEKLIIFDPYTNTINCDCDETKNAISEKIYKGSIYRLARCDKGKFECIDEQNNIFRYVKNNDVDDIEKFSGSLLNLHTSNGPKEWHSDSSIQEIDECKIAFDEWHSKKEDQGFSMQYFTDDKDGHFKFCKNKEIQDPSKPYNTLFSWIAGIFK